MSRNIVPSIWRDKFFMGLNLFERLLWIGIISVCADDQGRLQNNPALIRLDIFPLDEIKLPDIKKAITKFINAGKLHSYKAGDQDLLQILNWWKYQRGTWMGASLYPPPENWIDRVRYHTKGNEIMEQNWKHPGGFNGHHPTELPTPLPSWLPSREGEGEVKGEVNSEDEKEKILAPAGDQVFPVSLEGKSMESNLPVKESGYTHFQTAIAKSNYLNNCPDARECEALYRNVTDQITLPPDQKDQALETLRIILTYFNNDIQRATKAAEPVFARWCNTRGRNGKAYSKTNTGWLNWVLSDIAPDKSAPPDQPIIPPCKPDCPECKGLGLVKDEQTGKLVYCSRRIQ